ncbi:hypothetical protein [Dyadobacter tibetensis]|uniref:hypothetical protein n=1 Tax=Dyadobacter tibetensis TaxID=1211851 RepID=UPI000471A573|nr:hypothetical protein [Dyadobacter tibetensis]
MRRIYYKLLMMTILGGVLISSCSKSDKVEPEESATAAYFIEEFKYYMDSSDMMDSTRVALKDTTYYNPGQTVNVQSFTGNLNELVKTSQFQLTNLDALPKDVNLDDFLVSVPQNWNSDGMVNLFPEKFPFNQQVNHKPYNLVSRSTEGVTFNVPPKSRLVVTYGIQAINITCSFSAVLQNKMTGQRYPFSGT